MTIRDNKIPELLKATEKAIAKALHEAAVIVHGDSVVRCAVDTGNLRSSLAFDVREKEQEARVGTNTEYAVKRMPRPMVTWGQ